MRQAARRLHVAHRELPWVSIRVTGADLGRRAHMQASRFGAEFLTQRATGMRIDGQYRFVRLADGREVSSHVVLLAPGCNTASSRFRGRTS